MAVNHLTRARTYWRDRGYYVEKVEHVQRVGGKTWRTDLHGCGDLVAMKTAEYILVQVTSWAHVPGRFRKITGGEETIGKGQWERPIRDVVRDFLTVPGHRMIVEGWRKKAGRWERRWEEVHPRDVGGSDGQADSAECDPIPAGRA